MLFNQLLCCILRPVIQCLKPIDTDLRSTAMTQLIHTATGVRQGEPIPFAAMSRLLAGIVISGVGLFYLISLSATGAMAWLANLPSAQSAAFSAGMLAAGATALGALPVLFMRHSLSAQTQDGLLGFAAGVMLAASAFSLLLPAIDAGQVLLGNRLQSAALAGVALVMGVAAMFLIERAIPHIHEGESMHGAGKRAALLLVLAILIHNFPEGLAIGAAFAGSDMLAGMPVATAIAFQDVPEGLIVAVSLVAAGISRLRAVAVGMLSGLAEPLGAIVGTTLIAGVPALYPMGLAMAAGSMLFVVSHEIIPGTHRRGHESIATAGLVAGFAIMLVLDNAFA
jgi:zinc transporter, ZIP family